MFRGARVRPATAESTPKPTGGTNTLTRSGTPAPAAPPVAPAAPTSEGRPPEAAPVPSSALAESRAVPWETFFFCWSPSEQRPQRRHLNLESAEREAARLHRMYAKEFLVFEARLIPTPTPETQP